MKPLHKPNGKPLLRPDGKPASGTAGEACCCPSSSSGGGGDVTNSCCGNAIPRIIHATITWGNCSCATTTVSPLTWDATLANGDGTTGGWAGAITVGSCGKTLHLKVYCTATNWLFDYDDCTGHYQAANTFLSVVCDPLQITSPPIGAQAGCCPGQSTAWSIVISL